MPIANPEPVPRTGLANTVRFQWREEKEMIQPRDTFARAVLMGQLKLTVADVLCLQGNQMENSYDVTFHTAASTRKIVDVCTVEAQARPLSLYRVTSLAKSNFRVLTVHMYNPHVTDEAVMGFLGRYVDVVSGARRVRDSLGFWTGRRQFQVLLRKDEGGFDGFVHPPALFSLGADRGTLFYARQAPFCRRCRQAGHGQANCGGLKCRICHSTDHTTRDCTQPRQCHQCGKTDHLYSACPDRQRSYAGAAKGGESGEGRAPGQAGGAPGGGADREPRSQAAPGVAAPEEARQHAAGPVPEAEGGEKATVIPRLDEEEEGNLEALSAELIGLLEAQGEQEELLPPGAPTTRQEPPGSAGSTKRRKKMKDRDTREVSKAEGEKEGDTKRAKGGGECTPPLPSLHLFSPSTLSDQSTGGSPETGGGHQAVPGEPVSPTLSPSLGEGGGRQAVLGVPAPPNPTPSWGVTMDLEEAAKEVEAAQEEAEEMARAMDQEGDLYG